MKVEMASALKAHYPGLKVGVIVARDVKVSKTVPEIERIKRAVEKEVRQRASTLDELSSVENITSWRELYKASGLNPAKDVPAHEAMMRRIIRGGSIPNINSVVDLCNVTAARFATPVGAFDIGKMQGQVQLRLADEREPFVPLGSTEPEFVQVREVVYSDDEKIFSRYSKDADSTKITNATREVLFVVDGTPEMQRELVLAARDYLRELLIDNVSSQIAVSYMEA